MRYTHLEKSLEVVSNIPCRNILVLSLTVKTNYFIYNENVNAGYINYQQQVNKVHIQAGFRVENTRVKGN